MRPNTDAEDFARNYRAMSGAFGDVASTLADWRANKIAREAMEQRIQTEHNFGAQDPNAEFHGQKSNPEPQDPSEAPNMTNAEAASFGLNIPTMGGGVVRSYGLGKNPQVWQENPHTPEERRNAADQAKADAYREMGFDGKAAALEDNLYRKTLRAREDVKAKREDEKYALEQAAIKDAQAYKANRSQLMLQAPSFRAQVQFAANLNDYQEKLTKFEQAKRSPDVDPRDLQMLDPGPPPSMERTDPFQELGHQARLIALDAQSGRLDTKDYLDLQKKLRDVEKEGHIQALRLAQAGAPTDRVIEAFNSIGDGRINKDAFVGERVLNAPGKPPARLMDFKARDGSIFTINSLAGLEGYGAAKDVYDQLEKKRRADTDERKADTQAKISAAREARLAERAQEGGKPTNEEMRTSATTMQSNAQRGMTAMLDMASGGQLRLDKQTGEPVGPAPLVARYKALEQQHNAATEFLTGKYSKKQDGEQKTVEPPKSAPSKEPSIPSRAGNRGFKLLGTE